MPPREPQELVPDWSIHPGTILRQVLEHRGMRQAELAERTGLTAKHINQIVTGGIGISGDVALLLERALGIDARFWTRADADYQAYSSKQKPAATMGIMINLGRALVILPGGSSEESSEYRKACEAVGLRPSHHGHAIYFARTAAGSFTLVSAELGEPGTIHDAGRVCADRSGSQHSGEQHSERATLRGIRTSTGDAELVKISFTGHPKARVVVRTRNSKPHRSDSAIPKTRASAVPEPGAVQLGERITADVREALADVLAETLVSALWPAAAAIGPLEDYDSVYRAAEILLEPEALLLRLINASVRAAAHTLGFGILAPLIGQLADDLCAPLLRPSPEDQAASDTVKIIDIYLYLQGGKPAECPALRELSTETVARVIGTLLLKSHPSPQKDEMAHFPPGHGVFPSQQNRATAVSQKIAQTGTIRRRSPGSSGRIAGVSPSQSSEFDNLTKRAIARAKKTPDTRPARKRGPAHLG